LLEAPRDAATAPWDLLCRGGGKSAYTIHPLILLEAFVSPAINGMRDPNLPP
jgi:hypothetical protein